MKHITTAASSLIISIAALNLSSCNESKLTPNQAKQEAEAFIAEKTQILELREQNTQSQLNEAKSVLAVAEQKEHIAQEKLTQALQLTTKYEQARDLANQKLKDANETQQLAANQQKETLNIAAEHHAAKAQLEIELAKTAQLKKELKQSIAAAENAENQAKQQIAAAQEQLEEANKLTQDAVQVDAETKGAHLRIQQLERLLEENSRAYGKLRKDYHHLSRSYSELKKNSKPKGPKTP